MTRNLFVVFVAACNDPVCELFLPFWRKSGCDILVSSPLDAPSRFHGVEHVYFGKQLTDRSKDYWHLQSRMLDTMNLLLRFEHDFFWLTQYDCVTLGPLPSAGPDDLIQHTFVNNDPAFKAKIFTHPPWGFGRNRLKQFIEAARKYDIQTTERGFMDRTFALILEEAGMSVTPSNPFSWSANSMDTPGHVTEARAALKDGKIFFHGIKDSEMLASLLA